MGKFRQTRLAKLKNELPRQPLSPQIADLLKRTGLNISSQDVIELTETIEKDLLTGYRRLVTIDQGIGGVGFHNVNRQEGELLTGNYRVEFRPLFRPIQYVFSWITVGDLVWNARRIVQDSCLHIENAVKFRFNISSMDNVSLGVLLNRQSVIHGLEPGFLHILHMLNRIVYRKAKHSVENLNIDAHCFTPADGVAVYLICRWAGVRLLETTGLFNDWKRPN